MKLIALSYFLIMQPSSGDSIISIDSYLKMISFEEASKSKYILILPLNYDYYVDNHWVNQFLNFKYVYTELSVIIVERDVDIIKELVTNRKLHIRYDTKGVFFNSGLFNGSPLLCTKNITGYACANLNLFNAYQLKVDLFRKIKKKSIVD